MVNAHDIKNMIAVFIYIELHDEYHKYNIQAEDRWCTNIMVAVSYSDKEGHQKVRDSSDGISIEGASLGHPINQAENTTNSPHHSTLGKT